MVKKAVSVADKSGYLEELAEQIHQMVASQEPGSLITSDEYSDLDKIIKAVNKLAEQVVEQNKQLQQSQVMIEQGSQKLGAILESIRVIIFIIDYETHKIVEVNRMTEEVFGLSREEMIGNQCFKYICPNNKGNCPITDHGKKVHDSECEILIASGESIPVVKTVLEIEYNGKKCLLESAVDISRLKEGQEQISKSERELRNTTEMFELAVKGSTGGIWDWNLLRNEVFLSPEWQELMGYTGKGPISDFKVFLRRIHPEDRRRFIDNANHFLKGREEFYEEEFRLEFKEDDYKWILCKGVAKRRTGKPYRVAGSLLDISELKRAQEDAEQANLAKSHFLANMSHEIRTPMNAILGFAEILEKRIEDPDLKGQARSIRTAGDSLFRMINDILDISKLEAGRIKLKEAPCQIANVLIDIENTFSPRAREKDLDFQVDVSQTIPEILITDESRLRQILLNLIGNAIKFTETGFVKLKVVSMPASEGDSNIDLIFSIEDSGIGIDPVLKKHLFEPFTQSLQAEQNKTGGTGLGLAITRGLVQMMKGELDLETNNDPGNGDTGSRFLVRLPGLRVDKNNSLPKSEEPETKISNVPQPGMKVLVVDDIQLNRKLIESFLEEYEYITIHAENGEEAINLCRKEKPDIILMDLQMPVMNGAEASKHIKNDPEISQIPVLAMTANTDGNESSLLEAGKFDAILSKPVSGDRLIIMLNKMLRHQGDESQADVAEHCDGFGKKEISLPDLSIEQIKEFKEKFGIELIGQHAVISRGFIMSQLKEFAEKVFEENNAFGIQIINDWVECVLIQARTFDMNKLPETMNKFPEIIDHISKQLKAN